METTYYTCLNQHCVRHRNIFLDGDPEHEHCKRTVFRLEDHAKKPWSWMRIAIPVVTAVGALVAIGALRRRFS
jgi:hypothetical protein